jgi:hypothetical protein
LIITAMGELDYDAEESGNINDIARIMPAIQLA